MEIINNNQNAENEAYQVAYKKMRRLRKFYIHFIVYILVNLYLLILQFNDLEPGENFFSFDTFSVAFFWGIGLVAHAFSVFIPHFVLGKDWEERKVKQFMDRDKHK